jgi:hypothetical protein
VGENKAMVAIARKLLVVVGHGLPRQESDKPADAVRVARKLWRRAGQLKAAGPAKGAGRGARGTGAAGDGDQFKPGPCYPACCCIRSGRLKNG